MIPTRDEAFAILSEHVKSDELLVHAYSVEGAMRHFAGLYGGDVELWGVVGLLHDIDYEKYPDKHCQMAPELLRAANVDESIIRAVVSHGYNICSDVKPESDMEKVLYTIDELTGLITACAIVRPSKSVMDLEVKSVKKKFKSKGFAAGCSREVILNGCEMLGKELGEVIGETILGMREVAEQIGLS